ncbi:MAG: hypothetical protein U0414_00890 [Polyangiaceae bacterium]
MPSLLSNVRAVGLAFSAIACASSAPPALGPERKAAPPESTQVTDEAGVSFASAKIRDHLSTISRCLDEATPTPGWQHVPPGVGQSAGWCTGRSARRGCPVAAQFEWDRDQRAVQLPVLTDDGLRVSSFMIEAISVPPGAGWGARLTYSDPLHRGEFELRFNLFSQGKPAPIAVVPLGSTVAYSVRWRSEILETVRLDVPGSPHDELEEAALSPDALEDRFVPRLVALRDKVFERISKLGAKKPVCFERSPSSTDGAAARGSAFGALIGSLPDCRFERFDDGEQAALRATADKEIGQWIEALERHAPELREALLKAYPFDRCWP